MERLTKEQKEAIKKTSNARLIFLLQRAGVEDAEIEKMDRTTMMERWAELVADGRDKPVEVAPLGKTAAELELEKERLAFEREKFALEKERLEKEEKNREQERVLEKERLEQRKALEKERLDQERTLEKEKLDREEKRREQEIQLEKERLALEREKLKIEEKEAQARTGVAQAQLKFKVDKEQEAAVRLKKYADAVKNVLPKQPSDSLEIVSFFKNVEKIFEEFEIPNELWSALVRPYLNDRSKHMIGKLEPTVVSDYKAIKDTILRENHVSPPEFRQRFNELTKKEGETYVMFASKLKTLLDSYLEARNVTSLDDLKTLLIADRIKSTLFANLLRYVLAIEAKTTDGWMSAHDLAVEVDNYIANNMGAIPKSGIITGHSHVPQQRSRFDKRLVDNKISTANVKPAQEIHGISCFECGGPHLKRNCPRIKNAGRRTFGPQTAKTRVNAALHKSDTRAVESPAVAPADVTTTNTSSVNRTAVHGYTENTCQSLSMINDDVEAKNDDVRELIELPMKHQLHHFRVAIAGLSKPITTNFQILQALDDSGAEIVIAKSSIINQLDDVEVIGNTRLSGVTGEALDCPLVKIQLALLQDEQGNDVDVTVAPRVIVPCALIDGLAEELILPLAVTDHLTSALNKSDRYFCDTVVNTTTRSGLDTAARTLQRPSPDSSASDATGAGDRKNDDFIEANDFSDLRALFDDSIDSEQLLDCDENDANDKDDNVEHINVNDHAARQSLINDQMQDPSLKTCWRWAERGKANMYVDNGVLMRSVSMFGRKFTQVVVPINRRPQILEFGHNLAGHMSAKKSWARIRMNFWWPDVKRQIIDYVSKCEVCQKKARKTCFDKTPIKGTPRQQMAFSHWYVDVVGPLSGENMIYPYAVVAIDSCTRYPAAWPIKTPNAKNICNGLLQLWQFFGIPRFVSLDNATCNVARLTQEFFKLLGVTPRFITPYHSQANIAERTIGTVKSMIAKAAADYPKSWHTHLGYIMWALREVPSDLTGLPPAFLAMGIIPRGPLAVLRDSWTGEGEIPSDLNQSPTDYLKQLYQSLKIADKYANLHTKKMQQKYVDRFNKRARDKHFAVGDQVIILQPDSTTSRTFARWKGPATIIQKRSPYSYLVDLNGAHYRLHADHLRRFLTRAEGVNVDPAALVGDASDNAQSASVSTCAIIHEEDIDFGDISVCSTTPETVLPSQRVDLTTVDHLTTDERQQLFDLIDQYADVFKDTPGHYAEIQHSIRTDDTFVPKRLREYRIPDRIRPAVTAQIQELLDAGIIRYSDSPMVSPLVCILKGPGGCNGIRLATDFRYINRHTQFDAFPIPNIDDVIQRIGNSRVITLCDCSQGYWNIEVREEDRWKTAFICDDQLYEWCRTPYGLKCSGQTFCRAIQKILQPIRDLAASFVDDLTIHSNSFAAHLMDLKKFLDTIRAAGLTLKLKKCHFALPEVKFCGQIVGSGKRRIDPEKTLAIDQLKAPENKKQVRQILGFFGFFRDNIPRFAAIAKPLTDLTKRDVPNKVPWGNTEQEALKTLKTSLQAATESPLYINDPSKGYQISVDASNDTVGGALLQMGDDMIEHPIAFFSQKLTPPQRSWATIEKEAYALIVALRKYKHWLFGSARVEVILDHNPLTYLNETAPKSAKLMRWSLALQSFNIVFRYRAGQEHIVPDTLTRLV